MQLLFLPKNNISLKFHCVPTLFDHKTIILEILFDFSIGIKNPIFIHVFVSRDNKRENNRVLATYLSNTKFKECASDFFQRESLENAMDL